MKSVDIIDAQQQKVVMHNILIQNTDSKLTLTEKKIVLFIISKIKPYDKPEQDYTFSIRDFCEAANYKKTGSGNRYEFIRDTLRKLRKKDIIIHPDEHTELITGWFAEAELNKKTNEFTISFAKKVRPYLFELKQNFTRAYLDCILPMESDSGVILFLYLSSVKYKGGKVRLTLDELRRITGCVGKYEQSNDIKKNIINPALEDINTYSDFQVSYEPIKEGRKVVGVEFSINPNPPNSFQRAVNRDYALGRRDRA